MNRRKMTMKLMSQFSKGPRYGGPKEGRPASKIPPKRARPLGIQPAAKEKRRYLS